MGMVRKHGRHGEQRDSIQQQARRLVGRKGLGYEGARYWHPGLDYRFYALYPSVDGLGEGTEAACAADGTITVNGFDATRSIDLMTAQRTVATPEAPLTEDPGPWPSRLPTGLRGSALR